jgi:hypothetical protein
MEDHFCSHRARKERRELTILDSKFKCNRCDLGAPAWMARAIAGNRLLHLLSAKNLMLFIVTARVTNSLQPLAATV